MIVMTSDYLQYWIRLACGKDVQAVTNAVIQAIALPLTAGQDIS